MSPPPVRARERDARIAPKAPTRIIRVSLKISCGLIGCAQLCPQALMTGETGEKGARSIVISANAIAVEGFGILTNNWVQYGLGWSNCVDACFGYGNIAVFGRSQSYAAFTSNIGLLRRSRAGLDVTLYNNVSIPINRRQETSSILLGSALIASRPVTVGRRSLTLYGGAIRQTPIEVAEPVFPPISAVYNRVAGVSIALGKPTAILFEFSPGTVQRSGGMALVYAFPRKTGSADRNRAAHQAEMLWPATR